MFSFHIFSLIEPLHFYTNNWISTNSGQIGVPNHASIAIMVDIGILRIRLNDPWLTMGLMGDFARIG